MSITIGSDFVFDWADQNVEGTDGTITQVVAFPGGELALVSNGWNINKTTVPTWPNSPNGWFCPDTAYTDYATYAQLHRRQQLVCKGTVKMPADDYPSGNFFRIYLRLLENGSVRSDGNIVHEWYPNNEFNSIIERDFSNGFSAGIVKFKAGCSYLYQIQFKEYHPGDFWNPEVLVAESQWISTRRTLNVKIRSPKISSVQMQEYVSGKSLSVSFTTDISCKTGYRLLDYGVGGLSPTIGFAYRESDVTVISSTGTSHSATINLASEGKYRIAIAGKDPLYGNTTPQSSVIFKDIVCDSVPPSVAFVSPANNSWTGKTSLPVRVSASDATSGMHVSDPVTIGNTAYTPASQYVTRLPGSGVYEATVALKEGNNVLTAVAKDQSGNVASAGNLTVRADFTAPFAAIDSVTAWDVTCKTVDNPGTDGMTVYSKDVILNCHVWDAGSGVASASVLLNGTNIATLTYNGEAHVYPQVSATLAEGVNVLVISTTDKVGNVRPDAFGGNGFSLNYVKGNAGGPILQVLTPAVGTWHGKTVAVTGTAEDVDGVTSVYMEAQASETSAPYQRVNCTGTSSWTGSFSNLQEGRVVIKITATDAQGKTGTLNHVINSDSNGPVVNFASPVTDYTNQPTINVSTYGQDIISGLKSFRLKVVYPDNSETVVATQSFGAGITSNMSSPTQHACTLRTGINNIVAMYEDYVGNLGSKTATTEYQLTSTPAIVFTPGDDQHSFTSSPVQVVVSMSDDNNVVSYSVDYFPNITAGEAKNGGKFYRLVSKTVAAVYQVTETRSLSVGQVTVMGGDYSGGILDTHFVDGFFAIRATATNGKGRTNSAYITYKLSTSGAYVVNMTPANGSDGIPGTVEPTIEFSTSMNVSQTIGVISVSPSIGGTWYPSNSDKTLTYRHSNPFSGGASVTVSVPTTAQDLQGRRLMSSASSNFTIVDNSAPRVEYVIPADVNTPLPVGGSLRLGFTKLMQMSTIIPQSSIKCDTATIGNITNETIANKTVIMIPFASSMIPGETYHLTLTSNIADTNGNRLSSFDSYFRIEGDSGNTYSMNLYDGFNGISAPLEKLDGSKYTDVGFRQEVEKAVGSQGIVGAIFWYDTAQSKWVSSMSSSTPLKTFEYGEGALINVSLPSKCVMTFRGKPITQKTINIRPGLNFLSVPVNTGRHSTMTDLVRDIANQLGMQVLVSYMSRRKTFSDTQKRLLGYTYVSSAVMGGWSFALDRLGGDAILIVSNKSGQISFVGQGWK